MGKLELDRAALQNSINFFQNEIHQYEISMSRVLRNEYRKYLTEKVKIYQIAIIAIKDLLDNL